MQPHLREGPRQFVQQRGFSDRREANEADARVSALGDIKTLASTATLARGGSENLPTKLR